MNNKQFEEEIYRNGKVNHLEIEENVMFKYIHKYSGKLLDIGCGSGEITQKLSKDFKVIGIDFSPYAIQKTKSKGIKAICCDVDKKGLPFQDNTFDIVWAGDIIEHLYDPINLFKEVKRVLKPKGLYIFTTPNDFNIYMRAYIFITGNSPHTIPYRRYGFCKHHTLFSWGLLKYIMNINNFKILKYSNILHIPYMKINIKTDSKIIGNFFGREFIVLAEVKK